MAGVCPPEFFRQEKSYMSREPQKVTKKQGLLISIISTVITVLALLYYFLPVFQEMLAPTTDSPVAVTTVADTTVAVTTEVRTTEKETKEVWPSPETIYLSTIDVTIPAYSGNPVIEINKNVPYFTRAEKKKTECFENYHALDELGRCVLAYANISQEIRPTEERGSIGSVKPSGWHTVKYAGLVDGNYLYNRCHLIAYMLAGENANRKNLITGTRYLNINGMLPYEEKADDYLDKNPKNHLLYRATPCFTGDNLVADGVLLEAYSVEDKGKGLKFCVFCYNVQPGIEINYANGDSRLMENFEGYQRVEEEGVHE